MSTKNLARTIIEGGRHGYNKWDRAESHAIERALLREYLARARRLDDGFDACVPGVRPKVRKDFADKLGPARRWLRSHVGRPWDKVRSEMFERFDPRTLAGQHIVFDHLLRDVDLGDPLLRRYWRSRFSVDAHGILREAPPRPAHPGRSWRKTAASACEVAAWAGARRVGSHGGPLYWYVVASTCTHCRGPECCCPRWKGYRAHGAHEHYRQDQPLSEQEAAFWNGLVDEVQEPHRHPRR